MSNDRRTILFLNHSASRNGASILLLHFLKWLRANSDFRLEVLSDSGGPLLDEFRAVAPTRVRRSPLSFLHALRQPWASALLSKLDGLLLRTYLRGRRYDLVYANTAATWAQVAALDRADRTVLWHIHELPYALSLHLRDEQARHLLPKADRVVAVSEPVARSLASEFSVAPDRIDLVHGCIPLNDVPADDRQAKRQRILAQLGWPADAFVLGACGAPCWRKGTDLFLQIAHRLHQSDAIGTMRFLWVGGSDTADVETLQFAHDSRGLGIDSVCRRIPSTADVDDYYCAMDVFSLTSREDPFPLVMLEAAMHGLPTVCFAASGGGPEFVAEDAGIVVPYLDLDQFAHAVTALRLVPSRREALGQAAQRKVRLHHCIETQGPKLLRSIERCWEQNLGCPAPLTSPTTTP